MTYCCTRCMFEQIFISLILLFHFGGCILWPFSLSEILSSYSSTNCLDLHYICFSFIVFYHCASLGVRFLQGSIICLVLYFFSYLTKISTYTTNTSANFSTHAQATLQFTLGMAFILKIFLYLWTYLFWKLWVGLTFCCIWKPNYAIYLMYHIAKLFQQKLFLL